MSRCFPFQPRCYTKNGSTCMTLIDESIKLQSEKDKSRPERKKEKRNRKDKKKGRKYKEQKTDRDEVKEPSLESHYLHRLNISNEESSVAGYLQKARDDDCELLERSGLTQEFEEPVSSKDPVYLSDSSQHSKKRKRRGSSLSFEKDHGNGQTVIKILLGKYPEPEKSQRSEEIETAIGEAPSISSYKDGRVEGGRQSHPAKIVLAELAVSTELRGGSSSCNKSSVEKSEGIVETYEMVSGNWPPVIGMLSSDLDDQDWLTGAKKQNAESASQSISLHGYDKDPTVRRNFSLWPRAQLLPQCGIYALPYTVPL